MSKQNDNTLLGVALGAMLVGGTLLISDVMRDPEKAEAVRERIRVGYTTAKKKIGEGYAIVRERADAAYAASREKVVQSAAAVRQRAEEGYRTVKGKVEEGYAAVREKVGEGVSAVQETVAQSAPVRRVRRKVADVKRALEPAAAALADETTPEEAFATELAEIETEGDE